MSLLKRLSLAIPVLMGNKGIKYLIRDLFTTARTAGSINGTASEPGGESIRAVTDTGNNLSISSGALQFTSTRVGDGNPAIWWDSVTRAPGLATYFDISVGSASIYTSFGYDSNQSSTNVTGIYFAGVGEIRCYANNSQVGKTGAYTITDYNLCVVCRSAGSFYLIKGGAYSDWTLIYISGVWVDSTLYPTAGSTAGVGGACSVDSAYVAQLSGPWASDYGIATNRTLSPSAGDTLEAIADATIELKMTASTGVTQELSIRRTDDNNRLYVRMDQTASEIQVHEVDGGVDTPLGSAVAQTWTNSTEYRVLVQLNGSSVKTWVGNSNKQDLTGVTFNQTATGVKVSHDAVDVVAYPFLITNGAKTELDKYTQ